MSIVRYHRHGPRHALHRADSVQNELKQAFDRFFESPFFAQEGDDSAVVTAQWQPLVDVKEEAERFVIYADLPGIDPQDIEVSMDKGILSIRGERKSEANEETERFSRVERRYGSFHRRFALPDSADADNISAHGRHGVLQVVIPKKPETTPRRIQVGGDAPQGGEPTVQ
jgi:HSP20 family protein